MAKRWILKIMFSWGIYETQFSEGNYMIYWAFTSLSYQYVAIYFLKAFMKLSYQ